MISRAGSGTLGVGGSDTLTFTLSEASTDFDVSDVSVVGGVLSGFSGSGVSYTATFTPTSGATGSATVDVLAGVFTDGSNNNNTPATQLVLAYDTVAPTVSDPSTTTIPQQGTATGDDTTDAPRTSLPKTGGSRDDAVLLVVLALSLLFIGWRLKGRRGLYVNNHNDR